METPYSSIKKKAVHFVKQGQRQGQAIVNATIRLYPHISNQVLQNPANCFYDDTKVESFLKEVEKLLKDKA